MATEDPKIVARVQARDDDFMRELVRVLLPQLIRAARGAGLSADLAEDTAQNTLVTFIEKAPTFDGRAKVRTWVFGILYRKILESHRASRRDREMEDIDEVMELRFRADGMWSRPPESMEAILHADQIREYIAKCLDELKERYRAAFVLREVEQFSTDEICKILDVSANNLGVILYRARNGLRECLESVGMKGSSDAVL